MKVCMVHMCRMNLKRTLLIEATHFDSYLRDMNSAAVIKKFFTETCKGYKVFAIIALSTK